MNDIAEQRPSFFEGEVLSASDLEQLVVYLRDQNARHLLGGHTWGIVAGLQLLEQTAPSGGVDVYLLPGYAVDGYGRAIVVVNPLRLSVDWFNGQPSGPVQVWIRYDQDQTNAVRPGFQVCCDGGDGYSRVAESYAVEVGNKSLARQQSGISVAGEAVNDARTALRVFNDAGPVVCDASVPFQDLPLADDTKSRWLIPLGEVGWQAGTPGQFVTLVDATDPTKVLHARRLRRYIGVVAETVYAADGLIRLRRRTTEASGDQKAIDAACSAGDLTDASHDDDLENCADGPTPTELVWVEGRLRVIDDVRILGPGRLELRDSGGTNYYPTTTKGSVPTFLERTDHVGGTSNNADLAIVIGKATAGHNRLLIQQAADPVAPTPCQAVSFATLTTRVAVLDSGNVGIGTDDPDQLLELQSADRAYVHLRDTGAPSDLYVGAGKYGGVIGTTLTNDLRVRTGSADPTDDGTDPTKDLQTRVIVLGTGQVGIGTPVPDPAHALTVEAEGQASLLTRTRDQKHEGLLRTNSAGTLLTAHTAGDDLILSADGDESGKVWVKANGHVGIGTSGPSHKVGIEDSTAAEIAMLKTGGAKLVIGANSSGTLVGSTTNDDLSIFTNNTTQMTVKAGGSVGIGTTNPARKLDVRGDIALGSAGQFLAMAGYQNWCMIGGVFPAGSSLVIGPGWQGIHGIGTSDYSVIFVPTLASIPIVNITLAGTGFAIPVPLITATSTTGFTVTMWNWGFPLEFGFHFTAIAER